MEIQTNKIKEMEESPKLLKTKRIKKRKWTHEEWRKLENLVNTHGEKWTQISKIMKTRDVKQCIQKYFHMKKVKKRGVWSNEEDEKLEEWVREFGPRKWKQCALNIPGRCGKQCRERWVNTLDKKLKKGRWTDFEVHKLFYFIKKYQGSWIKISKSLGDRSETSAKNRFSNSVKVLRSKKCYNFLKILLIPANDEGILEELSEDTINICIEQLLKMKKSFKSYLGGMDLLTRLILKELLVNFGNVHLLKEYILPFIFCSEIFENCKQLPKTNEVEGLLNELIDFISETLGENDFLLTDENIEEKIKIFKNKEEEKKTFKIEDRSVFNIPNTVTKYQPIFKKVNRRKSSISSEKETTKNDKYFIRNNLNNECSHKNNDQISNILKNEIHELKMQIHHLIAISNKNMFELQSLRGFIQSLYGQNLELYNRDEKMFYMNKEMHQPLFSPMYNLLQNQINDVNKPFQQFEMSKQENKNNNFVKSEEINKNLQITPNLISQTMQINNRKNS